MTGSSRAGDFPPEFASQAEIEDLGTPEVCVLPASLGQERSWELDRLDPGNPAWNVAVRFRLVGKLRADLVERALNEIVRRHEVLRTTLTVVDGEVSQVIHPSLPIRVPVTDLRDLPQAQRDATSDNLSLQEARRSFDLTAGPLLRASLLRTEDRVHLLLLTPHLSVADYLAIGLMASELATLYDAYSRGADAVLPELSIQYGDYAIWLREQLDSEATRSELDYWKTQLSGLPLLNLPTDHPRPDRPAHDANITSFVLPIPLTDSIRDIANRDGATFFNTMLAALGIVLHSRSGQIDFGVATQVAGRDSVELESLVGLFINTIVLRLNLSGDPTFRQLLGRVQETGLQALAHQKVRFEQVLRSLRPVDYPSQDSLFRVNFICQRDAVRPVEFAGVELTAIPSKSQGAIYDLQIFLIQRADGWRLSCEYRTGLFELNTITRLLEDYRRVMECIVADPERRLSEFPCTENRAGSPLDAMPVLSAPAAGTMAGPTEEEAGEAEEIYQMPASLTQKRFWALEQMAPGNPTLHLHACMSLAGRLSVDTLRKSFQLLVERHETLRTTFERVNEEIFQVIAPVSTVEFRDTSLTSPTGGAELSRAIRQAVDEPFNLMRGPLLRAHLFRLAPEEHVLVIVTHHIIADGWSHNIIQRDLWTIYEAIREGTQPVLPALPIQYGDFVHWQQEWLSSPSASEQLAFWKRQLASPLPVLDLPTVNIARSRRGSQGVMESLLLPDDFVKSLKSLGQRHSASVFMVALTAYSALLNRHTGQEDMIIGSPVANRRPETESLIGSLAGPILLRLDLAGNPSLTELLARVREVTLSALSNAEMPFEVLLEELQPRSVRGRHPLSQLYFFYQVAFVQPKQLREFSVTPLPDAGLGTPYELQLGMAERSEGVRVNLEYNPNLYDAAFIRQLLAEYDIVLRAFVQDPTLRLSDLPVRAKLRSIPATEVVGASEESETLPDAMEAEMTAIWEALLGIRPIARNQSYFDLGGHSLLAVRLFNQIEKSFGVKLPLSILLQANTIQALTRMIRRDAAVDTWSPLVEIQRGGSLPPFFSVHGAGGNVLIYRSLARHLGPDQPFYGLQSQGLDGQREPHVRIEDMAASYLEAIKTVQPRGPYFLGGYCMGGTVALEIAQQLHAEGESVALVALFDTINWCKLPQHTFWSRSLLQAERLQFHLRSFMQLDAAGKAVLFKEKFAILRSRISVWRGLVFGQLDSGKGTQSTARLLARVWRLNDKASVDYVPRPYAGAITDFRPMECYTRYKTPGVRWDSLALGGEKVIMLPLYPATMLVEPFVRHLAAQLRLAIDSADKACSGQDTCVGVTSES